MGGNKTFLNPADAAKSFEDLAEKFKSKVSELGKVMENIKPISIENITVDGHSAQASIYSDGSIGIRGDKSAQEAIMKRLKE